MDTLNEIHNKAMNLFEEASVLQSKANKKKKEALELETNAAKLATDELTKSILYKSAASIAFQLGDYECALQLIMHGNEKKGIKQNEFNFKKFTR